MKNKRLEKQQKMNNIQLHIHDRKYEYLLLSLLFLLFGQLLFPAKYEVILTPILLIQNLVFGFVLFYNNKIWRIFILLTLVMIIGVEFFDYFDHKEGATRIKGLFYIVYFLSLALKTFQFIFRQKEIGSSMIAAVFSGFTMLAIFGSFLFVMIESAVPHSFSNLGEQGDIYGNLQYFSFITTLTIGYGDIAPLTITARKATMLLGLAGNFYTIFVAGIVIGKFIQQSDK